MRVPERQRAGARYQESALWDVLPKIESEVELDVDNIDQLPLKTYLYAWQYAWKEDLIPKDDPIPHPALSAIACERLIPSDHVQDRVVIDCNGNEKVIKQSLPAGVYNRTIKIPLIKAYDKSYDELGHRFFDDLHVSSSRASDGRQSSIDMSPRHPQKPEGINSLCIQSAFGFNRQPAKLETHFKIDGLTTETSAKLFAALFLTTDITEDQYYKPEYQYPRIPVEAVWEAYLYWTEEINDIKHKPEFSGGKKDIREELGVEKSNLHFAGSKQNCYKNIKFNEDGWWIYKQSKQNDS